ncbi:hypothetical protein Lupro_11630 [Lutibacter profundi]|uniref:TolB-like 6-blade propeller-like n=1 Tax=Lutibacter profundi TaxID=1622118 RepID=A0A109RP67_9FLAO|nr:BF3164 family lipoprotein [Lutibacter profundi]AMC11875.1 hypothetical protein Lupro_11630 [Lutibacter profundi]
MRVFLITIISLCLISCKKSNQIIISNNIKTFSQFPKESKIAFKNLVEFKLGNPRQIKVIDSTLILGNYASGQEYYLHNYSLSTGKFSIPYIRKGRDKNEIIGLATIGFSDNYLWLNDFTGKKMMLIDKDKVIKDSIINLAKISFNTNRNYRSILIDNLQIIATGNKKSKFKVQIIDLTTGNINEEFGELKFFSEGLPLDIINQATYSQTLIKPTKDKLVLAYTHTDIIEIFDLKTKKSISLHGPEKFDSTFKIFRNVWFENEKTRVAFIDGTATNKYIYLLYSGKNFSNENAYKGNYLFVYDWDMNPIKKVKLDIEVYQICITNDDKTIYSYDENTKHIVYADIN